MSNPQKIPGSDKWVQPPIKRPQEEIDASNAEYFEKLKAEEAAKAKLRNEVQPDDDPITRLALAKMRAAQRDGFKVTRDEVIAVENMAALSRLSPRIKSHRESHVVEDLLRPTIRTGKPIPAKGSAYRIWQQSEDDVPEEVWVACRHGFAPTALLEIDQSFVTDLKYRQAVRKQAIDLGIRIVMHRINATQVEIWRLPMLQDHMSREKMEMYFQQGVLFWPESHLKHPAADRFDYVVPPELIEAALANIKGTTESFVIEEHYRTRLTQLARKVPTGYTARKIKQGYVRVWKAPKGYY